MSTNPAPNGQPDADFDWRAAEADLAADDATTVVDGWPARLAKRITPPEPWRYRPISLAAYWRYASHGAWASKSDGPVRRIGQGVALVCMPVKFLANYVSWLFDRPSRWLVVLGLYLLLAHLGPLAPYIP